MISLTPKARPLIAPAPIATGNPRQLEGALNAQPQTPIGAPTAAPQQPLSVGPGGASDYQKMLAAQLMREGGSTAPVRTGYEGLGRMGQALSGAFLARDAQKKDQTQAQALAQMLQGGIGGAGMDPAMAGIIQAVAGQDPMAAAQMAGSVINQRSASQAASARDDLDFERQIILKQIEAGIPKDTFGRLIAGLPPEEQAAMTDAYLRKLTTAGPDTVINMAPQNINIPGEKQVDAVQKYYGETFNNIMEADRAAPKTLANIDQLDRLLDGIETGALAPASQRFKAIAKGAGLDLERLGLDDNVGQAEAATALSNQMALELRNPAGGAGMPGAMSDSDRQFLTSMVPSLSTSTEGRKMILDMRRRMAERDKEVARQARVYSRKHGAIDEGFFDELARYSFANPIAPPKLSSDEASRLPPGSIFLDEDGVPRVIGGADGGY